MHKLKAKVKGKVQSQQTAQSALGRSYSFHHTRVCPCLDPHELFRDKVYAWEDVRTLLTSPFCLPCPCTCTSAAL